MSDPCTLNGALLAVVDPSGQYRFVHPKIDRWLQEAPGLLSEESTFVRDGVRWAVAHTELGEGEVLYAVQPCEHEASSDVDRSQLFASLVEAAPVSILTLDLEMNVTLWNPASERLFGWAPEEVLGRPYPLVPADEWPRFEGFFRTVISGQGFTGVESTRRTKDGERIDIAISTAPIRCAHGSVVGAMAILEDITERKRLEERFREATKLEAIGRLAGGVAHDFNNALTVILAYAEDLASEPDCGAEDVGDAASAIFRSADHAKVLTQQLLAFSRRQVLQPVIVDLCACVQEGAELARRLVGANIDVRIEVYPEPCWIMADPTQIEQVVMNLATNAQDAMPEGGELRFETRRVQHHGRDWAQLSVKDTGVGMDAATQGRAFEPFFTTKARGQGTGLGLASVYGVVQQSGGEVQVESALGEGTTFLLSFPGCAPPRHTLDVPTTEETAAKIEGLQILVAEDEPAVRDVVRMMLESLGHHVTVAHDGLQALERFEADPLAYDLLLTDVVMPRLGGGGLAEKVRALRPELNVVFMSGFADDRAVHYYAAQGEAFLQKPFTAKRLQVALASALAS